MISKEQFIEKMVDQVANGGVNNWLEKAYDLLTTKESKVWKPEDGQKYWHIDQEGGEDYYYWEMDAVDLFLYETGNCYRTEEEAKDKGLKKVEKIKAIVRVERYIEEHFGSWEADWGNHNRQKWFIYYNHQANQFKTLWNDTCQHGLLLPHLAEESHAEQVIKEKGDDLRIIWGLNNK